MGNESPSSSGDNGTSERRRGMLRQQVEIWVLAVAMVVTFASGFIFGGLDKDKSEDQQTELTVPSQLGTDQQLAPPLDSSQIQGGLPPGHVPVDQGAVPGTSAPTGTTGAGASATTAPPPATTATTGAG